MSSVISVRINDTEEELLNQLSSTYECSLSSLIKQLAFERIEDEYDINIIAEYEKQKKTGKVKKRPIEELIKELDL